MTKIYLSPSTQERNIGVGKYGTEEKRMNEIADIIEPLLKENGFTIYRNKPSMSLSQVIRDSNSKNVDAHIALHTNAGGGRGCEVYYFPTSKSGKKLAQFLYDEIEPVTPSRDRGIKPTNILAEVRDTKAPCALIEYIFHDNMSDKKHFVSNMEDYAEATVKGICNYYGKPFRKKSNRNKGKLYKVQTGAFSKKGNAEDLAAKLKKDGYDTFIVQE